MTVKFTPAVRENVGLWVNMVGGTGSGKTFSALRLASGIAKGEPFAFIDTENRRGLHYADQFNFHHAELTAPFRPESFAEAVEAADKAGYPVIVIDSASLVWSGDGGVLDWQEDELQRLGGGNNVKMLSWAKPKRAHKKFVQKLLQVKAHVILCLRAEEKIEMVKGANGQMQIVPKVSLTGLDGWVPISEKNLPFEATCSFLLVADKPGVPHPIKLQEQHKALFPLDKPITEESGKALAKWAAGGSTTAPKAETLEAKRDAMIKHFGDLGVSVDRILHAVGKDEIAAIGDDEIATLRTLAVDVKAGDKSLLEAFPNIDSEPEQEQAATA